MFGKRRCASPCSPGPKTTRRLRGSRLRFRAEGGDDAQARGRVGGEGGGSPREAAGAVGVRVGEAGGRWESAWGRGGGGSPRGGGGGGGSTPLVAPGPGTRRRRLRVEGELPRAGRGAPQPNCEPESSQHLSCVLPSRPVCFLLMPPRRPARGAATCPPLPLGRPRHRR